MIDKITLQAARVNANLSLQNVAEQIGVTPQTLLGYERGVQVPKVNVINALLSLYGISYAEINWRPGARIKHQPNQGIKKQKRTLKELRVARGLTREEAAKKIGIGLSTVYAYERADRLPDVDTIEKILQVYCVQYEEIEWCGMPIARKCKI